MSARLKITVAWTIAVTAVAEAVTLHLRFGREATAADFNQTAPLLLQIHHMFWGVPLLLLLPFVWKNGFLQLEESRDTPVRPKKRVTVCETLDGTLRLFLGNRELTWSPVRTRPQAGREKPSRRPGDTIRSHQGQRPSAGHPWRKRLLGEGD